MKFNGKDIKVEKAKFKVILETLKEFYKSAEIEKGEMTTDGLAGMLVKTPSAVVVITSIKDGVKLTPQLTVEEVEWADVDELMGLIDAILDANKSNIKAFLGTKSKADALFR